MTSSDKKWINKYDLFVTHLLPPICLEKHLNNFFFGNFDDVVYNHTATTAKPDMSKKKLFLMAICTVSGKEYDDK